MKKKIIYLCLIVTAVSFIWTDILFISTIKQLSRSLGICISEDSILVSTDSHGGLNGDGNLLVRIEFEGKRAEDIVNQIQSNNDWKKTPLPNAIKIQLYGGEMGENTTYYSNLAKSNKLPETFEGYWLFIDRYEGKNQLTKGEDLLSRSSHNYTVGLYDNKTNNLYYFEADS
ncbi:MAG: hypothetical protein KC455_09970 [Carnobacterium sp.]|nr:hypothetical protein [Carnobacterium sp.]